jgi:RNA polymerase sigma-70 factor (ECF subfamily)
LNNFEGDTEYPLFPWKNSWVEFPKFPAYLTTELIDSYSIPDPQESVPEKWFELFYNKHFVFMYTVAKRFLEDGHVAEEIISDVFLKLWQRLESFPNENTAFTFVNTSVKNACLNHLRNKRRKQQKVQDLIYLLERDDAAAVAAQELRSEILSFIMVEVDNLTPRQKEIFFLAYVEGLSNEDISIRLVISNQSVRNEKYRLIKALKAGILRRGIPPGSY